MGRKRRNTVQEPVQEPELTCADCDCKHLSAQPGLLYCDENDEHVPPDNPMCPGKREEMRLLNDESLAGVSAKTAEGTSVPLIDEAGVSELVGGVASDVLSGEPGTEETEGAEIIDDTECCGTCNNREFTQVDGEEELACRIKGEVVSIDDRCDDWTPTEEKSDLSEEEIERSLSGRDLTTHMPGPRPTTDFHLYKFRDFDHELNVALLEVYKYIAKGREGDPSITIKLTGFRDTIKAGIVVDLPHKIKASAGSVETVRENGTFRIILDEQPGLFEEPTNTGTDDEQPENPEEAANAEATEETGDVPPDTAEGVESTEEIDSTDPEQVEQSDAA